MKVLGVIPCYNESPHISTLLEDLKNKFPNFEFLVVDDGSKDDSFERSSKHCHAVRLASNLGIGGAVQTGLRFAFQNGYDVALQIDGDGQHPPEEIPKFIEEYARSQTDLIIGSRFVNKVGFQSSWARRLGIGIIGLLLKHLIKQRITDPTSGFRLYSRKSLALFQNRYPTDYPEPISIVLAHNQGLSIREIPVNMKERQGGKSSILGFDQFNYMFRVILYLVLYRYISN